MTTTLALDISNLTEGDYIIFKKNDEPLYRMYIRMNGVLWSNESTELSSWDPNDAEPVTDVNEEARETATLYSLVQGPRLGGLNEKLACE